MAITITTDIGAFLPQRNPLVLQLGADASWQTYGTYFIELDLEVEEVYDSGTYVAQGLNTRLYPNQAGSVLINLSALLDRIFAYDRPSWTATASSQGTGMVRRYRYVVSDYGDAAQLSPQTSASKTVLDAGLPRQQENDFVADWITAGKFLTHQPRIKPVRHWQPEFLYFALPETDTFKVQVELIHEDGSSTDWEPGLSQTGDLGEIMIIPVGYEQLDIETQASDIVAWRVRILNDADEVKSEDMEYQITPLLHDLDRYFWFQNSLGGWDILRTTGQMSKRQLRIQALEAMTAQALPSDPLQGTMVREQIRTHETYTQATGFGAGTDWLTWYRDFLQSRQVYRVGSIAPNLTADGSELVPIHLQLSRAELGGDERYDYALEFTYREAFDNVG